SEAPIEIEFDEIIWPSEIELPWKPQAHYAFGGGSGARFTQTEQNDLERRIRSYLTGCPPAISGNGGHSQTLKVATQLVVSFALGVDGAMAYLREYNRKCEPPWSEKELLHKAQEADKNKLGRDVGAKIYGESSRVSPPEGFEGFDGGCEVQWEQTGTNPSNPSGGNR